MRQTTLASVMLHSQQPTSRRVYRAILLTCAVLTLGACTSQSRKTASNLDMSHADYASRKCQLSLGRAQIHDNIKQSRIVASPVAVLLSGGAWFLPVLAV